MSIKGITGGMLLLILLAANGAEAQSRSPAGKLKVGNWVEVRGEYQGDGVFLARRVDLVQAARYETLVGTIGDVEEAGHFVLLGQKVEIRPKTKFGRIGPHNLDQARVKVDGYYRSDRKFSARKIYPRAPGIDRIIGRIDGIEAGPDGLQLEIMKYRVRLPEGLKARHEAPIESYLISPPRAESIIDRQRDEEDLFGKGVRVTDNLTLAGQFSTRGSMEEDFDLNERNDRNREDFESTLRVRMVYRASSSLFGVAELRHRQLLRDEERSGRLHDGDTRLGETFLYWLDPFGNGLDFQAGRVDFDDEREWLYDQNLDTVRAIWSGERLRAELSYSESLSNTNPLDESARNSMLYLSNGIGDRTVAAYVIHRDFDLPVPVRRTHYGMRMLGEWLPNQESWLEVTRMAGRTGVVENHGWAMDAGTTWKFHKNYFLILGYAVGQGDDLESATDHTFRQSGLQDNNGKFAGVTSFRYYGELVDPELANLEITTAGLGWLPRRGVSLDLVWHSYRQNEPSRRLVDTKIDARPNGRNKDLGWEADLVLGWRTNRNWDLEAVAAWFSPGAAFDNADRAFLGKLQFRYRF